MLIQWFIRSDVLSLCAKGHSVGLTPILYKSEAWLQVLSSWMPEHGAHNKHSVTQIPIDPVLELLEKHKAHIVFRTGHDTRNAILIKENQDICKKSLIDVAKCYAFLTDKKEFTASSGRTFTILFGEGIRYYGNGENKVPETFDQTWNVFLAEVNLLRRYAGMDFINRDVLEIGCGNGCQSLFMKRTGAKNVVATDLEIGIGYSSQRRLLAQWPTRGEQYPIVFNLGTVQK